MLLPLITRSRKSDNGRSRRGSRGGSRRCAAAMRGQNVEMHIRLTPFQQREHLAVRLSLQSRKRAAQTLSVPTRAAACAAATAAGLRLRGLLLLLLHALSISPIVGCSPSPIPQLFLFRAHGALQRARCAGQRLHTVTAWTSAACGAWIAGRGQQGILCTSVAAAGTQLLHLRCGEAAAPAVSILRPVIPSPRAAAGAGGIRLTLQGQLIGKIAERRQRSLLLSLRRGFLLSEDELSVEESYFSSIIGFRTPLASSASIPHIENNRYI